MRAAEGEILKSELSEDLHIVKKIGDSRVIMGNENGSVCISLQKKDLGFYYERVEGGDA